MSPPPVELYRYRGYVAHWYDKSTSYHAAFGQGHLTTWGMSFLEKICRNFWVLPFDVFLFFLVLRPVYVFVTRKKQKEGGVYGRLKRSYTIQIYPIYHPNISQYIPSIQIYHNLKTNISPPILAFLSRCGCHFEVG